MYVLAGRSDVLRACLPRSHGVFKQTCTRFASQQAHGMWCVCDSPMCNAVPGRSALSHLFGLLLACSLFIYSSLRRF
jgi:hypothetical protein